MNDYEMVLIVDGSVSSEDSMAVAERISTIITNNGGKIVHLTPWSRRRLGYEIRKKSFGYYFVIYFKDNGKAVALIERQVSIDEFALKVMILKCDDIEGEQTFFQSLAANPRLVADQYKSFQQKD